MLATATLVSDGLIARSTLSARGLPAAAVRWRRLAAPVAHAGVSTTSLLADDATARARHIQEYPIALAFQLLSQFGFVFLDLIILHTGPFKPLLRLHEHCFPYVVQINLARVVHEWCEGEGFAATASAVVEDRLPRPDIDSHGHQLTCLILYLKMTALKFYMLVE